MVVVPHLLLRQVVAQVRVRDFLSGGAGHTRRLRPAARRPAALGSSSGEGTAAEAKPRRRKQKNIVRADCAVMRWENQLTAEPCVCSEPRQRRMRPLLGCVCPSQRHQKG